MYIKSLTIRNFKSFIDETTIEFGPRLNYLVGDNNTGKSTVLEALTFLFACQPYKKEDVSPVHTGADSEVEAVIEGESLLNIVESDAYSVLKPYIIHEQRPQFRVMRCTGERTVIQKNKPRKVTVKTMTFWNPDNSQFENPIGIDAKGKSLLDLEIIQADTMPGDFLNFSSSKAMGKLISSAVGDVTTTEPWRKLKEAHNTVFRDEAPSSITSRLAELSNQLQAIVSRQYGDIRLRIDFDEPSPFDFIKQGLLLADEGSGETSIDTKGSGLQRALTLAVIQELARSLSSRNVNFDTPLIFLIDEPETWLHPRAQLQLADALNSLAQDDQCFIVTHSPYLFQTAGANTSVINILRSSGSCHTVQNVRDFGIHQGMPTFGEINFRAFELYTIEFFDELYGYATIIVASLANKKRLLLKDFDDYLDNRFSIPKNMPWIHNHTTFTYTLPTYVRNSIHHPENTENRRYTEEEIRESTLQLLKIVENHRELLIGLESDVI